MDLSFFEIEKDFFYIYYKGKKIGQLQYIPDRSRYYVTFAEISGGFISGVSDPSLPEFTAHLFKRLDVAKMMAGSIAFEIIHRRGLEF